VTAAERDVIAAVAALRYSRGTQSTPGESPEDLTQGVVNPVLAAGEAAYQHGLNVTAAMPDGSKRPVSVPVPRDCADARCVRKWERATAKGWRSAKGWCHLTHERPAWPVVRRRLSYAEGLCIITGTISGNVVLLEADEPGVADDLRAEIRQAGWGDVVDRMDRGYLEHTPSGGVHWLVRVDGAIGGNTKLASRPKLDHEKHHEHDDVQVLIETREEGGQVVVAPSAGRTHPTGRAYELVAGGFATIPALTTAEWEGVRSAARRLDEMPEKKIIRGRATTTSAPYEGDSIMEWFASRCSWSELLVDTLGWTLVDDSGDVHEWRHPAAHGPISATTASDVLYVFSTSTIFPAGEGLSKFAAYALVKHDGDLKKAARHLWAWRRKIEEAAA
jgi:putative DNA primase/helicase